MAAPRSLWDPSYVEESWITGCCVDGAIRLIPRMKEKIAAHYPGTRLALSEYYYGGGADISGGIAEADALGIFGREDLFAAALWHVGSTDDAFILGGFDMFRNLDGNGEGFGDVAMAATTDDVAGTSVYASHDADDYGRVVIVAINRTGSAKRAAITIRHGARLGTARVYRLTAASSHPVRGDDVTLTATNALVQELPAHSVTTMVFAPR
jgi:hypothetical protein